MKPQQSQICHNCSCTIREGEKFCSICGQKKITKPPTLGELLKEFINSIFSLDSKFSRTLFPLFFAPGKLTNEYFEGKRAQYFSPVKLFLFFLTIQLIVFSFNTEDTSNGSNVSFSIGNNTKKMNKKESPIQNALIQARLDSFRFLLRQEFTDATSIAGIDSIYQKIQVFNKDLALDSFHLEVKGFQRIVLSQKDVYLLSPEAIDEKYQIKGFKNKLLTHQFIKFLKTPNQLGNYLLGHISWAIFLALPLLALFLKLLYVRSGKYYIEHLVMLLHFFAFVFALFIIPTIIKLCGIESTYILLLFWWFLSILYLIIAIKRVYKESILLTLFKIFIFTLGFTGIFALSLLVLLFITFIFF